MCIRDSVYRVGYHPGDQGSVPFKSFPVPLTWIHENNKYAQHTISLTSDLGFTRFYVDGGEEIGWVNLNPLGQGGDFIAFPVVGDVGFDVPAGQSAIFPQMEIANFRSPSNVITTCKEGNNWIDGDVSGAFRTFTPKGNSAPMLRTVFSTPHTEITKARLYVTSRGIYEVYLNGKRIGEDYFNPGITQYNKTHLYQTFDVTEYVHSGRNALGALLAEGWWSGGATFTGDNWNFFGDRQSLLAKLVKMCIRDRTYANATIDGGTDNMTYFVSVSAKTQDGFYRNSGTKYNQYDLKSNLDLKLNKYINLFMNLTGRMEDRKYPTRSSENIFRMLMRSKPNMPAYWPNGLPGPDIEFGDNPVVIATDATGYERDKRYILNGDFGVNINVPYVEGLTLKATASLDKNFRFRKIWQTPWTLYSWDGTSMDENNNPLLVEGKKGFSDPRLRESMEDNQNILLSGIINLSLIHILL